MKTTTARGSKLQRKYHALFVRLRDRRDDYLRRWASALEEGIAAVGPDTPAGARLAETQEFFAFMQKEMPALVERWQEYRSLGG